MLGHEVIVLHGGVDAIEAGCVLALDCSRRGWRRPSPGVAMRSSDGGDTDLVAFCRTYFMGKSSDTTEEGLASPYSDRSSRHS